jgi:hypothetical protein
MKKFEDNGFTSKVTNAKIIIEIPIKNLVSAFNYNPENVEELTVKRGKRQLFAEFVASHLLDEADSETGTRYIEQAFDKVFDLIIEGFETGDEFINDPIDRRGGE